MKHFRPLAVMLMSALLAAGTAAAADGKFGADRHAAMGLTCEACHGPDKANPATPDIKTCTQCHNTKDLVEKTKGVKPTNPHVSPHYQDQLDCVLPLHARRNRELLRPVSSVRLQGAVSRDLFLQVPSETSSRPSRPIRAAFQFMHAAHEAMTAIPS